MRDEESMRLRSAPDVVVVGAGVIGLSTAVRLAERGLRVEVRSRLKPAQTTSAVASAMVGPPMSPPNDPSGRRERASIAEFTALAGVPGTGVTIRRGRLASREPVPALGDLAQCAAGDVPPGFAAAFWAVLPLVDMPVYLEYLTVRLMAAGGQIALGAVTSLTDLADETPLIVHCSGLGARELARDEAVTPVRGQHVIVDNPGLDEFFIEAPFTPSWAAYWPYPDHVVLGGTQSTEDTSTDPDPQIAEQILQRCIEVEPRLGRARVLGHQVGLRPARPTVRLDVEQIGATRCVHNYGHGGSGVTLSWGSASEAAALLLNEQNVSD